MWVRIRVNVEVVVYGDMPSFCVGGWVDLGVWDGGVVVYCGVSGVDGVSGIDMAIV